MEPELLFCLGVVTLMILVSVRVWIWANDVWSRGENLFHPTAPPDEPPIEENANREKTTWEEFMQEKGG